MPCERQTEYSAIPRVAKTIVVKDEPVKCLDRLLNRCERGLPVKVALRPHICMVHEWERDLAEEPPKNCAFISRSVLSKSSYR